MIFWLFHRTITADIRMYQNCKRSTLTFNYYHKKASFCICLVDLVFFQCLICTYVCSHTYYISAQLIDSIIVLPETSFGLTIITLMFRHCSMCKYLRSTGLCTCVGGLACGWLCSYVFVSYTQLLSLTGVPGWRMAQVSLGSPSP